jgi:hypothetical protein
MVYAIISLEKESTDKLFIYFQTQIVLYLPISGKLKENKSNTNLMTVNLMLPT